MNRIAARLFFSVCLAGVLLLYWSCRGGKDSDVLTDFPNVSADAVAGYFGLMSRQGPATICYDSCDAKVVEIAANILADDVERVAGQRPALQALTDPHQCLSTNMVLVGTLGQSGLIDGLVTSGQVSVDEIKGRWEAYKLSSVTLPDNRRALVIIGSDRRGTAYGMTSLSRAIGVSPWYWWADVAPRRQEYLYVQPGRFTMPGPSVQYRGIFINDERFGGWAKWVEQSFDAETHQVGPKVYKRVFELLLRLRANYLWPAMHPGTQAFNAYPENARLADDYAIVMGSSHCEQMLRNNEGEWKAVGTYGDFNYITNRKTMQDYWETRVKTNGCYENTYTLGLRGIHDYPMEGANSTEQRVALMQQALDDQRDMLRRNISRPLEEIPQILCTYEEVLEAYHAGLKVPDDVIMLWSDDKQGYTRNLCNPDEMHRSGGAGIYYHLSYHGDPASWLWLSPLSPAFISSELTKAYRYGAQKVWVFNVGDIKPAEKEISFAMDLAWDVRRWSPDRANTYIKLWATETFGAEYAEEIADIQAAYYRLMASGKDAHVWFVEYPENEIQARLEAWQAISNRAEALAQQIPASLQDAYFELLLYPVRGAQMLNEYQLMSRLSMRHATLGDERALQEGERVTALYDSLNNWTNRYNNEVQAGKWAHFFSWVPYHWYYETTIAAPYCTPEMLAALREAPAPQEVPVREALSAHGAVVRSNKAGKTDVWIRALSPVRNFSKLPDDNVICYVECGAQRFQASATPINNVWHSPFIGPMWNRVGTLTLREGANIVRLTDVSQGARIDSIYLGAYPPFPAEAEQVIPVAQFSNSADQGDAHICVIPGLGYTDGVTVLPHPTPSYEVPDAPYVEYDVMMHGGQKLEVRTLPTLHIYEGRDARFAVQIDAQQPQVFSIHEGDFTSEWRLNVLRGYATRTVAPLQLSDGQHTVRVYLLDPGIVLQELRIEN